MVKSQPCPDDDDDIAVVNGGCGPAMASHVGALVEEGVIGEVLFPDIPKH